MKSATMDEDDYIEEEFEEVIDSDNESSDSSPESDTSEKQRRFEAMRKGQQAQSQVLVSKNISSTARNARNTRPISATYNLEAIKLGARQQQQHQQQQLYRLVWLLYECDRCSVKALQLSIRERVVPQDRERTIYWDLRRIRSDPPVNGANGMNGEL